MSEPRDFIGIFDFELNTLASGLGSLKIAPRVNPLVAIEILLTAILFLLEIAAIFAALTQKS